MIKNSVLGLWGLLCLVTAQAWAQTEEQTLNDFHLTLYKDAQDLVDGVELFTKLEDRQVFFGVVCTRMSPFPLLQVLMFDDEVISESPRLLQVRYVIDGSDGASDGLQGVLRPTDTFEERSNKVRIEFNSTGLGSMQAMHQAYDGLLDKLSSSAVLRLELSHRTLGQHEYAFSLRGLGSLLAPYRDICR